MYTYEQNGESSWAMTVDRLTTTNIWRYQIKLIEAAGKLAKGCDSSLGW